MIICLAISGRELERIVQIIFEEFDDALALARHEWKKKGRIQKIVLYGSYARGGWVDEPHTAKGYISDFDLLIIVSHPKLTDRVAYWKTLDDRLNRELSIAGTLRTPINFIVHSLQEVNDGLAHGRFFFMDVRRDGIALYQSDDTELHQPKPKTSEQTLKMAKEYYEEWFPSANKRFNGAKFHISEGNLNDAAFDLHQATERLYHCVLLVRTFYTPHVHNLGFLRSQAELLDARLIYVWPRDTKRDARYFELLKEAYVKARYSKHYRITADELLWLSAHIEELGQAVHAVCADRIAELKRSVEFDKPA